jgi:hypothetical protein
MDCELRREVEPYRRVRWLTASRAVRCAIVGGVIGTLLFARHEHDRAIAAKHEAEALQLRQLIEEVRAADARFACLRSTLSELGQSVDCAADQGPTRTQLANLERNRRELDERIAKAKALAALAELRARGDRGTDGCKLPRKRVHISTECLENPMTCL